ncbi:hypothetical protein VIGAN_02239200 [Vigna angularis var. angularis]|uniref:Uncharacterized protein n=1 Tax=Vigna angularis var. angularis TaxID=157739 RepID=A0A0S3RFN8_PHAAN|nr:hypothetical protein VIGAN_02239200 [Vigna angularis var. angularis]
MKDQDKELTAAAKIKFSSRGFIHSNSCTTLHTHGPARKLHPATTSSGLEPPRGQQSSSPFKSLLLRLSKSDTPNPIPWPKNVSKLALRIRTVGSKYTITSSVTQVTSNIWVDLASSTAEIPSLGSSND